MSRWSGACIGVLLLWLNTFGATAAEPKRVLLVQSYGSSVAPFRIGVTAFETALTDAMGKKVDIDEVSLEIARFQLPDLREIVLEDAFVGFLNERDANWKPDLVVTIGSPAGRFVAKYRDRLFPQTPVLYSSMDWRILTALDALKTNAAYVGTKLDITGFGQDILQLAPDTTNLVVVIGASPLEQVWADRFRNELASGTNRMHLTFLNDLSFEEMQKRVARLPPHSFIFLVLTIWDVEGVALTEDEALQRLHAVANAPINAIWQDHLGAGIVGGRLYDARIIGVQSARVAERILNGEPASAIPPWIQSAGQPQYDWRELQRWHIPESRLPAGSVIEFRQPGLWELYRWWIIGTITFCFLQTALIVALLVNRAKRRQSEAAATLIADISSKFVNLPPSEVDREIVDSQRRIFEFLDLDVSGFWQWSAEASGFFRITHFSRTGEGPQLPEQMSSQEYLPWFQQQVLAGRTVAVGSMDDLPPEAACDRETFRQFGFKSNLTIPLSVGGEPPIGALGFNTTQAEREWPDVLVKRLQLLAQIFANALARKQVDEELLETEARLSLAADVAAVGLWELNLATGCFWLTKKNREMFNFAADEVVTLERFLGLVHPDDQEVIRQTMQSARQSKSDGQVEYRIMRPDGSMRWILSRGRAHCLASGEPDFLLGVSIDITERKRAEVELRNLSGRLMNAYEEERARLARELHDDVTQRLARLAIDAGRGERGSNEVSPAETMRTVRDGLVRLSEDVHSLSYRLHPAVLEDLGLAEALKVECERFSRQEAVPAAVTLEGLPSGISPEIALCLFRVTQEALRNVTRHAKARTVKVSMQVRDGGLQLAVRDDGAGFVPALQRERPSLGLASMRERVHLLEGELDIESAPGHGTTILVWVPLKKGQS